MRQVFYPQKESLPSSYSASRTLYDLSAPHSLATLAMPGLLLSPTPPPISHFPSPAHVQAAFFSLLGTPPDALAIFSLIHKKKIFP